MPLDAEQLLVERQRLVWPSRFLKQVGGFQEASARMHEDTDAAVRSFLERRGMKKGDLAKFVEEAVRWRVLDQTLAQTKTRNVKSRGRADRRRH